MEKTFLIIDAVYGVPPSKTDAELQIVIGQSNQARCVSLQSWGNTSNIKFNWKTDMEKDMARYPAIFKVINTAPLPPLPSAPFLPWRCWLYMIRL